MSIRDDLKAFIDGELPEERAAEVRASLEADPQLKREEELLRVIGQEIRALATDFQPKGADRVLLKVRRRSLFTPPTWVWQSAAAVVLVSLAGALLFPVFAQSKMAARQMFSGGAENDSAAVANAASTKAPSPALAGEAGTSEFSTGKDSYRGEDEAKQPRAEGGGAGGSQAKAAVTSGPPLRARKTEQMLTRRADLLLEVESAQSALDEATRMANSLGGYVESSSSSGAAGALPESSLTMRVPVKAFDSALQRLRQLGTVLMDTSNSEDVTADYADTTARLKVLRAEEESYVTMVRAARRVGEVLEIKDRLSSVRQEIESLQAQADVLKDQSAMSTISATFRQKAKPGHPEPQQDWAEGAWTGAVNALLAIGRFLAQGLIYILVFSPIWLPIVLLLRWLDRRKA